MSGISVIIPTKDRETFLKDLLNSINEQTVIPEEVIIIDQSDNDYEIGKNYKFKIVFVKQIVPSLTKAKNTGIKYAKNELVLFLDDDIILKKDFIEIMIGFFEKYSDCIGCRGMLSETSNFSAPVYNKLKLREKVFRLAEYSETAGFLKNGIYVYLKETEKINRVGWLCGGLTVYKKQIFEEFQFDEFFEKYGSLEDIDFSYRVGQKYHIYYNGFAKGFHRNMESPRFLKNEFDAKKMFIRNYLYFFYKNFNFGIVNRICLYWTLFGMVLIYIFQKRFRMALIIISGTLNMHFGNKFMYKNKPGIKEYN
ncbi:glycosyltransferase family 2 protein [Candidatus Dependentiae bacterium]|nr:glycosyltransferase family 2 protein [Candidatus Dependentiae bacterium]